MTRKPTRPRRVRAASRKAPRRPPRPARNKADPLDAFVAAGARSLGLAVDRRWLPEIRNHLAVTLRHGASVAAFQFPDDSEPAPVFEA